MAKDPETDFRTQQDILAALGLKEYGFIDKNMQSIFTSIPPQTPTLEVREQLRPILKDAILYSLDRGRTTTGLRVEYVARYHPEIAIRMHDIIRLRAAEIEQVSITTSGDMVDLQNLWVTAYGFEILSALKMQLTTDKEGFDQIKVALDETGLKLRTGKASVSGVQMSNELKEAIWWIVNKRGRRWGGTTDDEQVIARFTRYLNGPIGKSVLNNLVEGETFMLQTSGHTLRVTKARGKAVVTIASFRLE